MVRFIHTADWHLGMRAHFLPDEARARFAQDRFGAVTRIAELAQEDSCAFVLVAGDVFDSNHVAPEVIARAIEALSAFTVPVYLLPGNHDALDPTSVYRTAAWIDHRPAQIAVLEDASVIAPPGAEGVEIVGAPWHSKYPLTDPVAGCYADASAGSGLRIVIGHGVVDELSPARDDPSLVHASDLRSAIDRGAVDYVALGDRHSVTEIDGTSGRAWYAGTPVSSDYGEVDPNQVLVVTLGETGCSVEPRAVGHWAFLRQSFELTSAEDIDALGHWLGGQPSKHTTVVKLSLRGPLSLAESSHLSDVLERHRLTFASLNVWEQHAELVVVPDQADLDELEVSGYVRETLDELASAAEGSSDDALAARDALSLLYRLAR
jgi:DNA repair exonuclease SbcCD nuclease subunit